MSLRAKALSKYPPPLLYPPQTPRAHQLAAVADCVKGFAKQASGRLHMPCGTGKTLVGMWLSLGLDARVILVVVPSIGLLKQTLLNWRANAPFAFAHLAVCSDTKVDDDISSVELLEYTTVTRDAARIAEFMGGKGHRVVFSTYASAYRCGYASNMTTGFDLAIADEAHHLGTARDDGHAASFRIPTRLKAKCRLHMTATPYRLENYPAIFGPVFHRLFQTEAVAQGLLCETKTIILSAHAASEAAFIRRNSWITQALIGQMSASDLCSHALVALAARDFGLKRVLSFHSLVAGADTFACQHAKVADALHKAHGAVGLRCEHISGGMPIGLREAKLNRMRSPAGPPRILASAKCINEGCDIPGADGVLFVDRKNSVEDIIQCCGRASRLYPGKKLGYVMLPVLLTEEAAETASLDDVPDKGRYGHVIPVVRAMQELKPDFAVEMQQARMQLATGVQNVRLPDDIILHTHGGAPVPADFLANLTAMVLRTTAESWEMRAAAVAAYVEAHGMDALVKSASAEALKLRAWLLAQKRVVKKVEAHALVQ